MTPAQTEANPETAFQSCVLDMMESDWLHGWEQEEQRETRRAALEEHHRRREWHEYLMCFTNPYRMTALYEVAHQMTDSEFWPAFRYAYEIADNLYQAKWAMQALLSTNRSGRKAIMSEEERAVYESLPDPVGLPISSRTFAPRSARYSTSLTMSPRRSNAS